MTSGETARMDEVESRSQNFTNRALEHLVNMDRTEELCLVTAAICAFGSALAAQMRQG